MVVFSKLLTPVLTTCQEYVHPWSSSCYTASAALFLHALQASFRLYCTVYLLALLMKGTKPSKKDIRRTLHGILQSTAFIGCHAVGFSLLACFMRNVIGHYNFFTFAFLPTFISSWFAILVERPSRRALLSLYVTNIASETLYYMLLWRGLVKPIPFGDVLIFTSSISCLLYLYRSQDTSGDSLYSLIRFIVGPYEQLGCISDTPENEMCSRQFTQPKRGRNILGFSESNLSASLIYQTIVMSCHVVRKMKEFLKSLDKSLHCPHPNSCLYYCLQGGTKVFAIGYGLQLTLKILMHMKKIAHKPVLLLKALKDLDTFTLGAFLGGFSFLYRFISCRMRRFLKKDVPFIAFPAGFLAGFTFCFYRSNTVALYVMWKSLQVLYLIGRDKSILPDVPHAPIFFHCLSTAILFQAAIFEPQNLRSSYWNFLHNMSGGRIGKLDRHCLDRYGLESSRTVEMVKAINRK